jgi:thiol-disulfide isomerase/thioredoxin
MKKISYLIVIFFMAFSCNMEEPTEFSEAALNDSFINLQGDSVIFKDILESHSGKTIVIDIWASWCSDCISGMPKIKALQQEYNDAVYIFLSLDRSEEAWKKGIEKYNVVGEHYFMQSGWEGSFGAFVDLDWIPRYMVVDANGNIKLFRAVEADDNQIKEFL